VQRARKENDQRWRWSKGDCLDRVKGVFDSCLVNDDLQKIWETGMMSADK
jgi:hypothetical protein